jgi:hypothetical protein
MDIALRAAGILPPHGAEAKEDINLRSCTAHALVNRYLILIGRLYNAGQRKGSSASSGLLIKEGRKAAGTNRKMVI